jgi:cell division protein FtsL
MGISTMILVLLLTLGVACALDRIARRHNARSRIVDM